VIITSGSFGYTGAGLSILLKNKKSSKKFGTKAKNAVLKPKCRLVFGLKNKKYFSSSMDSSDGLSTTLNEMSNQSKKKFIVTRMPSENDVFEFAVSNKLDPNDLILNGGEEYEIVATTSKYNLPKIKKYAKKHKINLYEIGYVTKGRGVFYKKNGKMVKMKDKGWQHLQKH
jgi:thiamine-monophosphate kinase